MKKGLVLLSLLIAMASGCQQQVSSNISANNPTGSISIDNLEWPVIMYYFHRTQRCFACLMIEENAARVIENNFTEKVEDGSLIWLPCNLDDPENADLIKTFKLSFSALVLARIDEGKPTDSRKLDGVWRVVNDPQAFEEYVTTEITQFLK